MVGCGDGLREFKSGQKWFILLFTFILICLIFKSHNSPALNKDLGIFYFSFPSKSLTSVSVCRNEIWLMFKSETEPPRLEWEF